MPVKYKVRVYLGDRPVHEIPVQWKLLHVSGFLVSSLTGLLSFMTMQRVMKFFDGNCILYSNLEVETVNSKNWTVLIEHSTWGSDGDCEFPLVISLASFIVAGLLMVFFLTCGSGSREIQRGLSPPKLLILPGLAFSIVLFTVSGISCIHTDRGIDAACRDFEEEHNKDQFIYFQYKSCKNLELLHMKGKEFEDDVIYLSWTFFLTLMQCVSWILNVCLLVTRCCCVVDYNIMHVVIAKIGGLNTFNKSFFEQLGIGSQGILLPMPNRSEKFKIPEQHPSHRRAQELKKQSKQAHKSASIDLGKLFTQLELQKSADTTKVKDIITIADRYETVSQLSEIFETEYELIYETAAEKIHVSKDFIEDPKTGKRSQSDNENDLPRVNKDDIQAGPSNIDHERSKVSNENTLKGDELLEEGTSKKEIVLDILQDIREQIVADSANSAELNLQNKEESTENDATKTEEKIKNDEIE